MTPKDAKILLIEKNLSIVEIARQLEKDGGASLRSLETMVRETLYGIRHYPAIADKLAEKFGIAVERPAHLQPVRERIKTEIVD